MPIHTSAHPLPPYSGGKVFLLHYKNIFATESFSSK